MTMFHLRYWAPRGRGQALRYLLADNVPEFKDEIIERDVNWLGENGLKNDVSFSGPFGALPVLIHEHEDGRKVLISQALAIAQYLAKVLELYPSQDYAEQAAVDTVACAAYLDVVTPISQHIWTDPDLNVTPSDRFMNMTSIMNRFNALLDKSGGPFFFGAKPTHADYFVMQALEDYCVMSLEGLGSFPLLDTFLRTMQERPGLARFLKAAAHTHLTRSPFEDHHMHLLQRLRKKSGRDPSPSCPASETRLRVDATIGHHRVYLR